MACKSTQAITTGRGGGSGDKEPERVPGSSKEVPLWNPVGGGGCGQCRGLGVEMGWLQRGQWEAQGAACPPVGSQMLVSEPRLVWREGCCICPGAPGQETLCLQPLQEGPAGQPSRTRTGGLVQTAWLLLLLETVAVPGPWGLHLLPNYVSLCKGAMEQLYF